MNSYTASNGVGLTITRDRAVRWRPGIPPDLVSSALREYFQAERDDALGRWRDPENPNVVVYRAPEDDDEDGRCVLVLDELSRATRLDWEQITLPGPADRYFTAHPLPEPEPKPWENAKEGDYWVLTIGGEPSLWHRGVRRLFWTDGERLSGTDLKDATAGRRIWPEGEASE